MYRRGSNLDFRSRKKIYAVVRIVSENNFLTPARKKLNFCVSCASSCSQTISFHSVKQLYYTVQKRTAGCVQKTWNFESISIRIWERWRGLPGTEWLAKQRCGSVVDFLATRANWQTLIINGHLVTPRHPAHNVSANVRCRVSESYCHGSSLSERKGSCGKGSCGNGLTSKPSEHLCFGPKSEIT